MELGLNVRDHLFTKLPIPTASFAGQTIIVTGANSGLGFETAQHLVKLGAEHVIFGVRSMTRGNDARKTILDSNPNATTTISVWELDLSNYASVVAFGSRAEKELTRLDGIIQNASIAVLDFMTAEDNERTITVNVVSTMLLTCLLTPLLRSTSKIPGSKKPRITIVTSASHVTTKLPKSDIYNRLNVKEKADMMMRYGASKLMQLFLTQSLAEHIPVSDIQINCVDPGAARTNIVRDVDRGFAKFFTETEHMFLARTAEHASRGIVYCIEDRPETHGKYLAHCKIYQPSRFVRSSRGRKAQAALWNETLAKLEHIRPGVTLNVTSAEPNRESA